MLATYKRSGLQPLAGISIPSRFRTKETRLMSRALAAAGATQAIIPGMGEGGKQPGYKGAAADQISALPENGVRPVFTAGAAASVVLDSAVDHDYFDFNGTLASAYSCVNGEFALAGEDVTWIYVIRPAAQKNNFIHGQLVPDGGDRAGVYINSAGTLYFNNKVSNTPAGSRDQLGWSGANVDVDETAIVWVSWRDSGEQAALGRGVSGEAGATAQWANKLIRGGTSQQFGNMGSSGSNGFSGRGYGAFKIPAFHTDIDMASLLAPIADRFAAS